MATIQVEVGKIIEYLNTIPAIVTALGTRIYWGEPIEEKDLTGPYLTINIVSESSEEHNKGTLLEFRYIAAKTAKFSTLMDIRKLVFDNLEGKKSLGTFKVYGIIEENVRQGFDTKLQKVIIQDMRFYFIT